MATACTGGGGGGGFRGRGRGRGRGGGFGGRRFGGPRSSGANNIQVGSRW